MSFKNVLSLMLFLYCWAISHMVVERTEISFTSCDHTTGTKPPGFSDQVNEVMSLNLVVKYDLCECHAKSKLVLLLLLTLSDCLSRFKEENQPMNCGSASYASNMELQGGRVFVHPPEQKVTQQECSHQHPVIIMLGLYRQHLPQGH